MLFQKSTEISLNNNLENSLNESVLAFKTKHNKASQAIAVHQLLSVRLLASKIANIFRPERQNIQKHTKWKIHQEKTISYRCIFSWFYNNLASLGPPEFLSTHLLVYLRRSLWYRIYWSSLTSILLTF